MNMQPVQAPTRKSLNLLSRLLIPSMQPSSALATAALELKREVLSLSRVDFEDMLELANSNHVAVRGLESFLSLVGEEGVEIREWATQALSNERARIETAIGYLTDIRHSFEKRGFRVAVIKSLDHWPDLGSDLDLFTDESGERVIDLMREQFNATIASRSWGDRLASKWNFAIPGLPELVEVHVGRLGQTGEQGAIASSLINRSRMVVVGGQTFRLASVSDRLMISTLQRMYRHFYFRLCDIVDTAALSDTDSIDFDNLRTCASDAGIWEGVATYLLIVSDYVKKYRGSGLDLPQYVRNSARFAEDVVFYARGFIRVPIMPQSVRLYSSQLAGVFRRGQLHNGARLSLLPWLATAAVVGQKITGSDKGIW